MIMVIRSKSQLKKDLILINVKFENNIVIVQTTDWHETRLIVHAHKSNNNKLLWNRLAWRTCSFSLLFFTGRCVFASRYNNWPWINRWNEERRHQLHIMYGLQFTLWAVRHKIPTHLLYVLQFSFVYAS